MDTSENLDLVVVGAGVYGLTFAITYHRLHPAARLLIIDSAPTIGGPWALHRIFPGLKTNNLWGTYAHPDFPMDEAKFGVKKGEHVPAEKVYEYLTALAEWGDIKQFLRLNTAVETVFQTETGWKLLCRSTLDSSSSSSKTTITTAKLVLSTGNANQPSMPKYPTSPSFQPLIIHSSDFPSRYSEIVKPSHHTLVIGAGKSAWDIAYACTAQQPDSTATMLIRPSGNGPIWMSPTHVTPFSLWLEKLVFTRFFGYMSPCPWASTTGFEGWIRAFLHRTWLGRKIVGAFWGILGDDVVQLNKLKEHPETAKLRPWRGAFEVGNALGIMNYPTNFFDLVREGRIKIVVDEVERFDDERSVVLKGWGKMDVDAVVCATGWKTGTSLKFEPESLARELGLPTSGQRSNGTIGAADEEMVKRAEKELGTRFPFLKARDHSRMYHPDPSLRHAQTKDETTQPYRLYRFVVPPSDLERRSIGFAGALMSLGNSFCAYIQSLWLTAYLDGTLKLNPYLSPDELKYDTYLETEYCKLRGAMAYGHKYPDLVFDSLPYFDVLLRDMGFEGKRKGGWGALGVFREAVRSYGPEDYSGLVGVWEERMKKDN